MDRFSTHCHANKSQQSSVGNINSEKREPPEIFPDPDDGLNDQERLELVGV